MPVTTDTPQPSCYVPLEGINIEPEVTVGRLQKGNALRVKHWLQPHALILNAAHVVLYDRCVFPQGGLAFEKERRSMVVQILRADHLDTPLTRCSLGMGHALGAGRENIQGIASWNEALPEPNAIREKVGLQSSCEIGGPTTREIGCNPPPQRRYRPSCRRTRRGPASPVAACLGGCGLPA